MCPQSFSIWRMLVFSASEYRLFSVFLDASDCAETGDGDEGYKRHRRTVFMPEVYLSLN